MGFLLSHALNERVTLCYQAPAPRKTPIYPNMKKVTCYPKFDPVTALGKEYSFGYRYAFHKVRSSGLTGLPVSRSLFCRTSPSCRFTQFMQFMQTEQFMQFVREHGRPVLSGPTGLVWSLYELHKTP